MIQRLNKTPIMHRSVVHQGVAYLGGVIADDLSKDIKGQTQEVCAKLDKLLAEAGSNRKSLLSATIYITDMSMKQGMNEAWTEWLESGDLPSRATIGISDLGQGVLIEVVVTAAVG